MNSRRPDNPPTASDWAELWDRQDANERRIDELRADLPSQIRESLDACLAAHMLTEEERQWVRLSIKRQAQTIRLREAIIEKSLTSLIWAGIVGVGVILYEYLKGHGWKP